MLYHFFISLLYHSFVAIDWPDLSQRSSVQPANDDVAFIISIEDYAYAPDIEGATKNARAWESFFRNDLQVSETVLLLNENATKEEMLYQAHELRKRTTAQSRIWFVFIGHGAPSANGGHGMLVGVDAQQTARGLESRSVPIPELISILERTPSKEQIAIIDACFSGLSHQGKTLAPGLQPFIATKDLQPSHVQLLTAADGNQFAGSLPEGNRPAFSYIILGGLRGWADQNQDQQVSIEEVVNYTQQFLLDTVVGRTQTPQKLLGNDDIILTTGDLEKPLDYRYILEQKRIDAELQKAFLEQEEFDQKSNDESPPTKYAELKQTKKHQKSSTTKKRSAIRWMQSRKKPLNHQLIPYETPITKENVAFFTDNQGNYLARYNGDEEAFFVGNLETMFAQKYQGYFKNGTTSFSYTLVDPRFVSSSERDFSFQNNEYTLQCGTQSISFVPYTPTEKEFLSISWFQRPWQRYSYLLARDEFGTYYFIDHAREPENNTDLRLYIGDKGNMSYQPLDKVVMDAAGIVLQSGNNRFVVNNSNRNEKSIYWTDTIQRTDLMEVNLYQSQEMIYNELGVYPKNAYYTACDPYVQP